MSLLKTIDRARSMVDQIKLSLIGFDDEDYASYTAPPLSSRALDFAAGSAWC